MKKKILMFIGTIVFVVLFLGIGALVTKLTVHDLVSVDQGLRSNFFALAHHHYDNPFERIAFSLGKGQIVSVNPPFGAELRLFTIFHIPLTILRGKPNETVEISYESREIAKESERVEKAEASIREFMNDPDMELVLSYISSHYSNYMVWKEKGTSGSKGTQSSVYIFQEKRFINNDCQVYTFEVNPETSQVIQVQTNWPWWFQAGEEDECPDVYSNPAKSKEEVEKLVFEVLAKDPEYTGGILLRSDIQAQFRELKYNYSWTWEDESVSLPEGFIGNQHPVLRVMMTKDGRFDYYLNTFDIFEK